MVSLFAIIGLTLSAVAHEPIVIPPDLDEPHNLLISRVSSEDGVLELVCTKRVSDCGREQDWQVSEKDHQTCMEGALALRNSKGKLLALSEYLVDTYGRHRLKPDLEPRLRAADVAFHRQIVIGRSNHRDRRPLEETLSAAAEKKFNFDLQTSSKLFHAYASHLVRSPSLHWHVTDDYAAWESPARNCDGGNYRQIGRGIGWQGKELAAVCETPECGRIQFRLFDRERGCSEALGKSVAVREVTAAGVLAAMKTLISEQYMFEDIVAFYTEAFNLYKKATYDGKAESRGERVWLRVYDTYLKDLFDPKAVESILNREVLYWQLRPRKVDHIEFRRWLAEFSDRPETFDNYNESCRFQFFDLNPDTIRASTTMKAWGLSGYEAFNQWEDNHELENLVLRPMMGRYLRTNLAAYFEENRNVENGRILRVDMEWRDSKFLSRDGFTIRFQAIRDGKVEEAMSVPASFAVEEFPKLVRKFAKKIGCALGN